MSYPTSFSLPFAHMIHEHFYCTRGYATAQDRLAIQPFDRPHEYASWLQAPSTHLASRLPAVAPNLHGSYRSIVLNGSFLFPHT